MKNDNTTIILLKKESKFSSNLVNFLTSHGYLVNHFSDFESAVASLESEPYDISILDNLELLNRHSFSLPSIIISYEKNIEHLTLAYSNGCHDYIRTPFHARELLLRLKNLQQKLSKKKIHVEKFIPLNHGYCYNIQNHQLYKEELIIYLTKMESLLLELFIKHSNKFLTSQQIKSHLWGSREVSYSTIRTLINRLRKKFNENNVITNRQNFGYMLIL